MQKYILFSLGGLIVGLIVGFVGANSLNRNASYQQNTSQISPNAPPQTHNALVKDQPLQGGMMPDIAETLDKAKNEPDNFEAQVKAGTMYLQIGRFERAVEFFEKANQINPNDYETIVKLGNAYFDLRQFETAAKWYEQALAKKSDDANVRTDFGITFVERAAPDLDRAIKEFQTSLQTNPQHEPTLYNLAVAYFKKGNIDESKKILAQLETLNPQGSLAVRLREILS